VIEARGLSKSFDGRRACWDLSFEVAEGEVFGLLGPNGAGKTTTLRMLAGLYAPDAGQARVAGCDILPACPGGAQLRQRVGLLTESPGFYDRLTALENLLHFARLYGIPPAQAQPRARKLLQRFQLAPHQDRLFAELSRGMKQKLAIARALVHEPRVVLLDEPTVGLDPEATREVRATIEELAADGITLVLCTHDLDEVERLCSRAAFIAGQLLAVHPVGRGAPAALRVRIVLSAPHPAAAAKLRALQQTEQVREDGRELHVDLRTADAVPELVAALCAAGARVEAVHPHRDALEESYLQLLSQARERGLA
jgi:ABC-2 type transport system ATP-binding protein